MSVIEGQAGEIVKGYLKIGKFNGGSPVNIPVITVAGSEDGPRARASLSGYLVYYNETHHMLVKITPTTLLILKYHPNVPSCPLY